MYRHTIWSLATLTLLIFSLSSPAAIAATDAMIWRPINERTITLQGDRLIVPRVYRTFALDQVALSARLAAAPLEHGAAAGRTTVTLLLPLPDGTFGRCTIMESPIKSRGWPHSFPRSKPTAARASTTLLRSCDSTGHQPGSTL